MEKYSSYAYTGLCYSSLWLNIAFHYIALMQHSLTFWRAFPFLGGGGGDLNNCQITVSFIITGQFEIILQMFYNNDKNNVL